MCEQGKKAESGRCTAKPITPATVAEEPPPNVMELARRIYNRKYGSKTVSMLCLTIKAGGYQDAYSI